MGIHLRTVTITITYSCFSYEVRAAKYPGRGGGGGGIGGGVRGGGMEGGGGAGANFVALYTFDVALVEVWAICK